MKKTLKDKLSDKLVKAFLKNKIITALPKKFTKKLTEADKYRKLCESKIKEPVVGFTATRSDVGKVASWQPAVDTMAAPPLDIKFSTAPEFEIFIYKLFIFTPATTIYL